MSTACWPRALVLCLALVLCYANSLQVPFLLDDPRPGVPLDYSTRVLVWASFDLNRALSGSATWSYHVFNALVHLACGLLLFGVLRRGMAHAAPNLAASTRTDLAFVTSLLWLCHPLQTAAVTYLSQRAETLGAFFYLAVLYCFLRSTSAARPLGWQALALLSLALGFATKETTATAPLVVLLYDALFLTPGPLTALRLRRGFYAGVALVTLGLGLVFVAPPLLGGDATMGLGLRALGPLEYARTQPGVVLHYLRLAFWPHPLCFDYGWPIAKSPSEYLPESAAIAALLLVSAVLLVRRSWVGFAGACFFVLLAPTSSFVPIRDPAFEHRMYLPLGVVLLLLVVAGWWICTRLARDARRWPPILATVVVLASAALTVRRNQDYRSALTLWQGTVALAPHHARAHDNLGVALLDAGRPQDAVAELLAALRLDPEAGYVYLNLGVAFLRLGQLDRAIPFFERAVEVRDARAADALGNALSVKGDHAGAAHWLQQALAASPDNASIHYRLAQSLEQLGRAEEAGHHYEEAHRLDPRLLPPMSMVPGSE